MRVTRRQVCPADDALLLRLYAASRESELSQVQWPAEQKHAFVAMQFEAQRRHYQLTYPNGSHQVICADDAPVGRIWSCELSDELRIMDITVLPDFRGRGIGSSVLREIVAESERLEKPLRIWIETWNPSQIIFQHFGFVPVGNDGVNTQWERKTRKATVNDRSPSHERI